MKTKKKVLIGLMALCLAGAAGTTFALVRGQDVTKGGVTGAFDQAVYLNWDSNQSQVTIDPVTNLVRNTAQYRRLAVTPKSTKTVVGKVVVTFTLAATDTTHHIKGLSVAVYRVDSLPASDAAAGTAVSEAQPVFTLAGDSLTNHNDIIISVNEQTHAAHETSAFYVMKFNWDGSNDSTDTTKQMQGTLTVSQAFSANNA